MKLELELTPLEAEVLAEARRAGGFHSIEDLARVALWMQAEHMGVVVPIDAFALPFRPALQRLLYAERQRRDGDTPDTDHEQPDLFATSPTRSAP